MEPLSAEECRVLGVLIEKQMTTPDQYPLTLNGIVAGSNQKNNRDPIMQLSDDDAQNAAEALQDLGLVVRVEQAGARVPKYKHVAGEKLQCRPAELALLSELLVRGPQTVGELRGRASRMQAFESLPAAEGFLQSMIQRDEPLVRRIAAAPGTRAEKFMHLLGQSTSAASELDADLTEEGSSTESGRDLSAAGHSRSSGSTEVEALASRVDALESQVAALTQKLTQLSASLGLE